MARVKSSGGVQAGFLRLFAEILSRLLAYEPIRKRVSATLCTLLRDPSLYSCHSGRSRGDRVGGYLARPPSCRCRLSAPSRISLAPKVLPSWLTRSAFLPSGLPCAASV